MKKHPRTKKLSLNKRTLRELNPTSLDLVHGGGPKSIVGCFTNFSCHPCTMK